MSHREAESPDEQQRLRKLFEDVTGQTEVTETRQDERGKAVVEPTGAEEFDADPVADGLEDAIGQSADDPV